MALPPLRTSAAPLLRSTKSPDVAPALVPPSSPSLSPVASSASTTFPAGHPDPRCRSYTKTFPASLIHATHSPTRQLQIKPSPASNRPRRPSCTMGLFNGVKNAVKRIGGKRHEARRGERMQNGQTGFLDPQFHGEASNNDEESSRGPEADDPFFPQPHHAHAIAPQPQPPLEEKPQDELQEELEHDLQQQSLRRSDPPLAQLPKHASPRGAPQAKQRPRLQLETEVPLVLKPRAKSDDPAPDIDRRDDAYKKTAGLGLDEAPRSSLETVQGEMHADVQNLQEINYYLSDGDSSPYRFPFQSGRDSEDHQSLNSGFDKALSFKAPSYRGQGRVDSHAMPVTEDKLYDASIKAEIVRMPGEDLRKPTLRAQRVPPPPEQPQYHGIEELSGTENEEPLFSVSEGKLGDEPVSPTSKPKYCPPKAESVVDSDFANSDASALRQEAEPDVSEASSDAESVVSELLPNRARQNVTSPYPSSVSPVPRAGFRRGSICSFNTIRSAEWMKGAPLSSFYPHPEEPDPPAAPSRHLAGRFSHTQYRGTRYNPVYNHAPAMHRLNGHSKFNSRFFPSIEEVDRRVAQGREEKRQNELHEREQEQREVEAKQREREKEIYHSRITKLEYEKRELTKANGQISLKNDQLQEQCARITNRFVEQRRKLVELDMYRRAQEDFEARLQDNPHGLLTPPDTASSRSTPANPERVRVWAETLADPALLTPEALRTQEALQEQEAMQEHGGQGRGLGQAVTKASHELSDPTSNKSSPVHPVQPNHSYLETLPEMSVEFIAPPQAFHSVHKHPKTKAQERKVTTPIYSRADGTVPTLRAEQQLLHRGEPEFEKDHVYRDAKPNGDDETRHDSVSYQVSRSPVKPQNEEHRQQFKQVQFEQAPQEANVQQKRSRYHRNVVDLFVKQQTKPVSKHASPPATPLLKQSVIRNKPSIQQMHNPLMVNSPNVPMVNNQWNHQIQDHQYYSGGTQVFQRQQLGHYENSMASMQQKHPQKVSRQHSAPQLAQAYQQHQFAHQHAHSSPQVPTLHHQGGRTRGLAQYARNQMAPEILHKPSIQTLNSSRPSTSNGQYRPVPNTSLRPSTSHGAATRGHSSSSPLPPRPGTSHSTFAGGHANNLGGGLAPPLPPPMPHLPQSFQQQQQIQPTTMRSNPHHMQPAITTNVSSYVYPPPNPLKLGPTTTTTATANAHVPPVAGAPGAGGGGSARSLDTSASHRTQLSKMQNRAYKGLAQNERANAERSAQAAGAAKDAPPDSSAADGRRTGGPLPSSSSRGEQSSRDEVAVAAAAVADRLRREQILLAQQPQARARDLMLEDAARGRVRDEIAGEVRRRIQDGRERKEMEMMVAREVERAIQTKSRLEGWA